VEKLEGYVTKHAPTVSMVECLNLTVKKCEVWGKGYVKKGSIKQI